LTDVSDTDTAWVVLKKTIERCHEQSNITN